jgi:hypothetical protein
MSITSSTRCSRQTGAPSRGDTCPPPRRAHRQEVRKRLRHSAIRTTSNTPTRRPLLTSAPPGPSAALRDRAVLAEIVSVGEQSVCPFAGRRQPTIAPFDRPRLPDRTKGSRLGGGEPGTTRHAPFSSGPGARSALTRVAAHPREREPAALADRRGSGRQQAHRRLPQSRQSRAVEATDHGAARSTSRDAQVWRDARRTSSTAPRPALVSTRVRRASAGVAAPCPIARPGCGWGSRLRGCFAPG